MTIDDAIKAMDCIDAQGDGTAARAFLVAELHLKLLEDPEEFWDYFFERMENLRNDPTRELAERLLRSGAVNGLTTIADAWELAREQ